MGQPPKPGASPGDADGGIASDRLRPPVGVSARVAIARFLAVAFVARGVFSASDALSVATDGLRPLPIIGPMAFSAVSPLWSLVWAALAVLAGIGLALRWRVGWFAGVAVSVAYLVSGIADLSLLDWSAGELQLQRLIVLTVDLLVPTAAMFLLSAIPMARGRPLIRTRRARRDVAGLARRAGIVSPTPSSRAGGEVAEGPTVSPLERWRRRP